MTREVIGMTTFRKLLMTTCVAAGALASAFTLATGSASADEPKKLKIFLSLSYSGNSWQSEAANIVKALAQTPPYDQLVELKEVISGTDVQAQISAYESMVSFTWSRYTRKLKGKLEGWTLRLPRMWET